jgi:hypothetical protein
MARHHPFSRGVSQLMYVGDDGTPAPRSVDKKAELAIGAVTAYLAVKSRGLPRALWAGIAAYSALKLYRAR